MPRQNQDHGSYVRGVTSIIPSSKGGTGATTPDEAVVNLQGIHRNKIDQGLGLAMLGQDKLLLPEYFSQFKTYLGPRLKGPKTIYRNCMARFMITNFSSFQNVVIGILDNEMRELNKENISYTTLGPYFAFKVPNDSALNEITLHIKYNQNSSSENWLTYKLTVDAFFIEPPVIKTEEGTVFPQNAWLRLGAPIYHGSSEFDSYIDNGPGAFRGISVYTKAPAAVGGSVVEYEAYSGIQEISPIRPTAYVSIAGRLKSPTGIAYAEIDGIRYPLSTINDQYDVVFKDSLSVRIVTSPGEEIWVGFIRPMEGNLVEPRFLSMSAEVQYAAVGDSTWHDAILNPNSTTNENEYQIDNSLSIPLSVVPPGIWRVRVRWIYRARWLIRYSDWSNEFQIGVQTEADVDIYSINAPYVPDSKYFGLSLASIKHNDQQELYIGALYKGARLLYQYHPHNTGADYVTTIIPPIINTRTKMQTFGERIAVSENGEYLFVTAPDSTFSDVTGTTGAVYVYRRIGDRWVFFKQMLDENRLNQGYGTLIATAGNYLFIGTAGSISQVPSIYVYQIDSEEGTAKFNLLSVYSDGLPGEVNYFNIMTPQGFDFQMYDVMPFVIYSSRKDLESGLFKYHAEFHLFNKLDNTFALSTTRVEEAGATLTGDSMNYGPRVISYRGMDTEQVRHIGYIASVNIDTGELTLEGWEYSYNSEIFRLIPAPEYTISKVVAAGNTLNGGIAMDDESSTVFMAAKTAKIGLTSIDTGYAEYPNAGIVNMAKFKSIMG